MSDLTRKQERAIELLLSPVTKSLEGVALEVGIDSRTLRRWMHNASFKSEFDRARRQLFDQNIAGLAALTGTAVTKLKTILDDDKTSTRERLYAIRIILNAAQNANIGAIEDMMERLEAALEGAAL